MSIHIYLEQCVMTDHLNFTFRIHNSVYSHCFNMPVNPLKIIRAILKDYKSSSHSTAFLFSANRLSMSLSELRYFKATYSTTIFLAKPWKQASCIPILHKENVSKSFSYHLHSWNHYWAHLLLRFMSWHKTTPLVLKSEYVLLKPKHHLTFFFYLTLYLFIRSLLRLNPANHL